MSDRIESDTTAGRATGSLDGTHDDWTELPGDPPLAAYAARPEGGGAVPTVLFIHENRGLVPYVLGVCRELARCGFHVVAPDLLTRVGGTRAYSEAPDDVTTRSIPERVHLADLLRVYDWLDERSGVHAVVGFCFGAEMGWTVITQRRPIRAVLFYGAGPDEKDVPAIATPTLAVHAQYDDRVNDRFPPVGAAIRASGAPVTSVSYPGTRHAFHDHNRPDRYNQRAADHAWTALVDWLTDHRSPDLDDAAG